MARLEKIRPSMRTAARVLARDGARTHYPGCLSMKITNSIEQLEARIAPAGFATTFTDVDGDLVTIKVSKGTLADAVINKVTAGLGEQLHSLNLSNAVFLGANVAITAKPQTVAGAVHGDGSVNVGEILGSSHGFGTVTVAGDLGRVTAAGDLTALSVGSMGKFGTTTGAALPYSQVGKIGTLAIRTDLDQAAIFAPRGIGSVAIGGSMIGGGGFTDSGSIICNSGSIGSVKIGGDLRGGDSNDSGKIYAFTKLGAVTIGGTVSGGLGSQDMTPGMEGQIHSEGDITSVKIGGDLRGGIGGDSGKIYTAGKLGPVTIGGSLLGGAGSQDTALGLEGQIHSDGDMSAVKITGSVIGSSGARSGQIKSASKIASVTIGGSVIGGSNFDAGSIIGTGDIGMIKIVGDLKGGTGDRAGRIHGNAGIASVSIGGSLVGGTFDETGEIRADLKLGKVTIGQNIVGSDVTGNATLDRAGYVVGNQIGSVTVTGSIIAGTNSGTGRLTNSGGIRALHDLGSVIVKGSLVGNSTNNVTVAALGQAATTTSDVAIKSVSVTGRVQFAEILAGYNADVSTSQRGVATDADAQIGSVTVNGDWTSSSIAAGATSGTDSFFGDTNDAAITGGKATIFSSIASVVIKGQALGTLAAGDAARFGIVAQFLGSVKIGATKFPLLALHGTDTFAAGKAQILGPSLGTFNGDGFDLHAFEV